MDNGVKILELVKNATRLYETRNSEEKKQLLGYICQNSIWRDGILTVEYKKPFDLFAKFKKELELKNATPGEESGVFHGWLPFMVEVRTFLIESQYAQFPDFALVA